MKATQVVGRQRAKVETVSDAMRDRAPHGFVSIAKRHTEANQRLRKDDYYPAVPRPFAYESTGAVTQFTNGQ